MASDVLAARGPGRTFRRTPVADLPAWPIVILFAAYGGWWLLGLGAFAVAIVALPMLVLMAVHGRISVPVWFGLWVVFLAFVLAAAVELNTSVRFVGYSVRLANYVGAGLVFVYLMNCSRQRVSDRLVIFAMVGFLSTVVLGGWLGVLLPHVRITTPTELLLPSSLTSNEYVRALVHPSFAEVQRPYGAPRAFTRPSAPFAYTNGWGCNVALLVPFAAAALSVCRLKGRILIGVLLVAALVPAFATLNRGMFLAVTTAVIYAALRYGLRGRILPLAGLSAGFAAVVGVGVVTGVVSDLAARLQYSQTNVGRMTIYREAFVGALQSPLLGNGSPRPSSVLNISIGTQGQLWNVMFSYGFIAAAAYVGWFAYAAVASRRGQTPVLLWMHVVLVLSLLTTIYYGYDGPQLAVAMVAAAVALRPREPAAIR